MDVDKLKVAELRNELSKRGLDTKGTKPILVSRLKEFLANEGADSVPEVPEMPAPVPAEEEAAAAEEAPAEEAEPEKVEKEAEQPMEEEAATANGDESADKEEAAEAAEVKKEEEPATPAKKEGEAAKPAATPASDKKQRGVKRKANDDEPYVVYENEPEIDDGLVCLDWYDSDLSLRLDKDNLMTGEPFNRDGWGHVWSGARATHGFTSGKVGYEVKLLDNLESKLEGEKRLHELRLGWSVNDSCLQLGESANSFAYAGNGMKATGNTFEEYGATFAKDDVVGAFVDLTSDPVSFHFTKNGEDQGQAFSIAKSEFAGKALFPHVSSRNIKFDANFGKAKDAIKRENWFEVLADHQMVGEVADTGIRNTPR